MTPGQAHIGTAPSNRPLVKVLFLLGIIICGFWISSFFPDLVTDTHLLHARGVRAASPGSLA